jgi:hypothetical protein
LYYWVKKKWQSDGPDLGCWVVGENEAALLMLFLALLLAGVSALMSPPAAA